jgi:ketosteroid isomerase-like protein
MRHALKSGRRTHLAGLRITEAEETNMTSDHESSLADRDLAEIAKRSYRAYVDKDRSAMERLIAEDFHFTSPLDNRIDRKTYFERCWPNSRWIDRFDFIAVVPSDDRVYVTYVGHSDQRRSFRNTEVLTVRDGKIVEAEVYFGWNVPHSASPGGFVEDTPQS